MTSLVRSLARGLRAATGCGLLPAALLAQPLAFDSQPKAHFEFHGPVGERIRATVDHWLLPAPAANPGMLDMFRVRDRQPAPQVVPWAGEFIGKYLISAIQTLRLVSDPRLESQVAATVQAFLATQAEDGYLGPFPRELRLLRHWDLWGHYHAIQALLLWHERTNDPAALAAARRAADLVCRTYLDTGRRVLDAGDPEMNMAILTGLVMLHRRTGESRYLQMAREVEADWEQAGDYLRSGLDGREFFQSPRPRWESLHDLQGLLELWRVTGEAKYRDAFVHHWRSIRRWDRRNTGGFSSGEQATGNPYAPTAIETCCTVAWMALTLDYLRLTGDPLAADDLELATLNAGLGAQHPSGRWWTYNTPMDGVREASAHTIVFQSRAGTPELNCCSVNAPRVTGMLSEWAVMSAADGLVVNWLGPVHANLALADATPVALEVESAYPVEGGITLRVAPRRARKFTLRVRIPGWAAGATVQLNRQPAAAAAPGEYWSCTRRWSPGDTVRLVLPLDAVRVVAGAQETAGQVSLYRGPLLLAYDPRFNAFDEAAIPPFHHLRGRASEAPTPARGRVSAPSIVAGSSARLGQPRPWLLIDAAGPGGEPLRLVDFASAGATGTRYRSWLPAASAPPAPAFTQLPRDAAVLPPRPVRFQWRGERRPGTTLTGYRLRIAPARVEGRNRATHGLPDLELALGPTNRIGVDLAADPRFTDGTEWTWSVASVGPGGITWPDVPPARFRIDRAAPPQVLPPEPRLGPAGELVVHTLREEAAPAYGTQTRGGFTARGPDGTELNGRDQMLVYAVPVWPEEDFTVAVRVQLTAPPTGRNGQIFSAWSAAMDDPLRLVVEGGRLFARIEAGGVFSTPGVAVPVGEWHAVAAVKQGSTLTLFLDGRPVGSATVPALSTTQARDCALGGNPHFSGSEFVAARFADFQFLARALTPAEVAAQAGAGR